MLEVTFKYAGAGDSLFIRFKSDVREKIGIIDCKRISGANPTLEEIKKINPSTLDFILLSHPHDDHLNGMEELLEYCDQKGIGITLFGFTVDVNESFLNAIITSDKKMNRLANLWRKTIELDKKGIIKHRSRINTVHEISVFDEYKIKFLAPVQLEVEQYYKTLFSTNLQLKASSNPNLLSLVTIIEAEDWYVIFTSDAEKNTLKRIGLDHLKKSQYKRQLKLGQVPHHGSIENHYKEFWKTKFYEKNTPLAISVGPNNNMHPSQQVIDELVGLDYKVEQTWSDKTSNRNYSPLDMYSNRIRKKHKGSTDLTYTLP